MQKAQTTTEVPSELGRAATKEVQMDGNSRLAREEIQNGECGLERRCARAIELQRQEHSVDLQVVLKRKRSCP